MKRSRRYRNPLHETTEAPWKTLPEGAAFTPIDAPGYGINVSSIAGGSVWWYLVGPDRKIISGIRSTPGGLEDAKREAARIVSTGDWERGKWTRKTGDAREALRYPQPPKPPRRFVAPREADARRPRGGWWIHWDGGSENGPFPSRAEAQHYADYWHGQGAGSFTIDQVPGREERLGTRGPNPPSLARRPQRGGVEEARKAPWHGPVKDKLNTDEIAKLFDIDTYEDLHERNIDNLFEAGSYARKEALDSGASEEEAEAAEMKAEEEADTELFHQWHDGVMAAAEYLFEKHRLVLVPVKKSDYPFEYRVVPEKSWEDAATAIVETINGVGYFHFSSLREFLDSGPYTPRSAVLTHLHYTARYPEVYGDTSARRIYERSFR
jgi:hypothetical protein